jgi:hypothetical protein
MADFFVRPIVDTLEEWDRLLQRQIAEQYGIPVEQVHLARDCGGGLQVHVDTTKWDEIECCCTVVYGPCLRPQE